jgi:multidrug efflux pump subunit AcrA (membrane-fusion protein)
MNGWKYYFPVVALMGLTACGPKYEEVSPKSGPVTEAVFASGSVDPKDAYMVTGLSDGFIVKSLVSENDLVKDRQVLFVLDNRQQHTQVNIAQTNLKFANIGAAQNAPALQQQKNLADAALTKYQNDSVTYARYKRLYATQSVSKQDLDNAEANCNSSRSNYLAAQQSYLNTVDKTRQDLENSRDMLANAVEGNEYYNLIATGGGKVYQVFKKQGDLVRRGEQVAQLGNPDSIVINLDVDEGTIARVKLGQEALVELNSQKNKPFHAVVSKIYPHFNDASQSYKVEARFTEPVPGIIAGTQLQANIITARKENVLLLPHVCLLGDNRVIRKAGGKLDTVKVETGIVSDDWIEIVSGITAADKVVKPK